MATTSRGDQPLVVVVSGGGPVGLTFSLHLAMMMGENVKITIYEGRWFFNRESQIHWQADQQGKTRREQIVTLQEHVTDQMPEYIKTGLFKETNEDYVWSTSRNIRIRDVEDRLLNLIQPFVQNRQIELVPENLHEGSDCLIKGDFDVLVGVDGSNSFVRRYCNIHTITEGVEYACGLAYSTPDYIAPGEELLPEGLNCILTVSQTRYSVNTVSKRHGYLNIRLLKEEYDELQEHLQGLQLHQKSIDLSDKNQYPDEVIWIIIRQGLELFQIESKYVRRIVPIGVNIRHASVVSRELCFEIQQTQKPARDLDERKYKTALAFLVGDAAMNTHFWPGRGMNNGMKAAIALARNILRSCTSHGSIEINTPLRYLDFLDYESFITRLRAYERQGHPLRVLIDPIDKYIDASYSYCQLNHAREAYMEKFYEKLKNSRVRLEGHPEWPHRARLITDDELSNATDRVTRQAVLYLTLANPWTTREISEVDVLVEDIFKYDLKRFLPPPTQNLTKVPRPATTRVHRRLVILWIIGNEKDQLIDHLVGSIKKSPKYTLTKKNKDSVYELYAVKTVEDAKKWVESNQELIKKSEIIFKVITVWKIRDDQSAVDAIRALRSVSPRVPVLIFTNKHEVIQPALEFPNVLVTDAEYELQEFVEICQDTQWNPGREASSQAAIISPRHAHTHEASPLPYPIIDNLPVVKFDFPTSSSSTTTTRGHLNSTALKKPQSESKILQPEAKLSQSPPKASQPEQKVSQPEQKVSQSPPKASQPEQKVSQSQPKSPQAESKVTKLEPMLFWVDSEDHDRKATDEIRKLHPTLKITFVPTFHEAEIYLNQSLHEIEGRKKLIVISRSFYPPESKGFVDVAQLFQKPTLGIVPLGVYTRSRTSVLERTPNPPPGVEIFDTRKDLLAFINHHLTDSISISL